MVNTKIFATFNDGFDIKIPVSKWDEPSGLNAIPHGFYTKRNMSHEELKKHVKQFVVHWSVSYRSKQMFNGLNARGLSANFLIDDTCDENGYALVQQTLPILYAGWSQGQGLNTIGVGCEISYMPQAYDDPDLYSDANCKKWNVPKHETTTGYVHGSKLKVFLPTKAQMNSLKKLIWGFSELFPDVPMTFPKDKAGKYINTVLPDPLKYTGLANHYNLKRAKIDTCGLDLADIEKDVAAMKKFGY